MSTKQKPCNDNNSSGCFICHSNQNPVPVCNREDVNFLLHKLLELPSEITSLHVQLCDSCKTGIEEAKIIYGELVLAVKQFKSIQRKIADSLNRESGRGTGSFYSDFTGKCKDFVVNRSYEDTCPLVIQIEDPVSAEVKKEVTPPNAEDDGSDAPEIKEENETDADSDDDTFCLDGDVVNESSAEDDESDYEEELATDEEGEDKEESESAVESDDSTRRSRSRKKRQVDLHCKKCDFSAKSYAGLRIHLTKIHNSRKPRRIPPKPKKKLKPVKPPRKVSSTPGKFKCTEEGCGRSFMNGYMLQNHISRHLQKPMYKCKLCDKDFYNAGVLSRHERHHHPELLSTPKYARLYNCDICSKKLRTKNGLARHKKLKHGIEPPKRQPCPEEGCPLTFPDTDGLRYHLSKVHGHAPSFKCDNCEAAFPNWKQKWRHQQKVHENGLALRPFVCELCGTSFTCRDYLSSHKATRHGSNIKQRNKKEEDPSPPRLICDICGKSLKTKLCLRSHRAAVHFKNELKEQCHLCDKKFLHKIHLKNHLYHHHRVGPEEYKVKKPQGEVFPCPVTACGRKFYADKSRLDKHIKQVHGEHGEKPAKYKCKYCGKDFHEGTKHRYHEEIHENKERNVTFPCDICGKGFVTPRHVLYHKKNTHKVEVEDQRPWMKPRQEQS